MSKKIIITGASSGIGKALTAHLASIGHHVIAVARNRALLQDLQLQYPSISIIDADITQKEGRSNIKKALSPEDTGIYLIHNAGIASPSLLSDISEKTWDMHHETNLKAPLFLTQLLLPHLKHGGRVLHVSSGLAHNPLPGMSAYGTSKAAMLMIKAYANTEHTEDILFGSAMPGIVDTAIQTELRTHNEIQFPAVNTFHRFFKQGELLQPTTAAKFLSWLLINTENTAFIEGDWDIYDTSHHTYWAEPGEVIQRQKTAQERSKAPPMIDESNARKPLNNLFYLLALTAIAAIIAGAFLAEEIDLPSTSPSYLP